MIASKTLDKMPTQRPKLSVILTDELKAKLETLAEKEERSLSQMALILIREGIELAEQSDLNTNKGKK